MKKLTVKNQKVARALAKVDKHKPELLTYSGVGMMVGGTAAGIYATTKLPKKLEELQNTLFALENGDLTGEELEKAMKKEKMKAIGKIALSYAPAAGLTVGGAVSVLSGFGILKQRHACVVAALAVTTDAFASYRNRVIEEYGEEVDYNFKHNIRKEEIVNTDEEGNVTSTERSVTTSPSQYATIFDSKSCEWKDDIEYNLEYIKGVESYVNTILQSRGHVMLMEVLDQLGIQRTPESFVVGWKYKGNGDGYIDLGVSDFEKFNPLSGLTTADVILDFNVDGVVYDLI